VASEPSSELPIFELPVVLLPGELMPLHIFEDRYRRMICHCLAEHEPFGIVFRDQVGGARRIGCTARVIEVLERFDDGRMNIVVTGEEPFQVIDRFESTGYPAGEIEPVAEPKEDIGTEAETDAEATRAVFADLVERVGRSDSDEVDDSSAYAIAARVELPVAVKQELLELRSESERMRVLDGALRDLLDTLDRSAEVAERARMNGKVTLGPITP